MTKPVITIDIERLVDAPEVMIQNYIRHLPVMTEEDNGDLRLAGIVSMRDFFREWVETKGRLTCCSARWSATDQGF